MTTTLQVLLIGSIAGLTIPLGALLCRLPPVRSRWLISELHHGVLAFGAGALLAAVALVLIPAGIEQLALPSLTLAFFSGGALFVAESGSARLLAFLIALQNLPEAISGFTEMTADGRTPPKRALMLFALLAPLGPLAAYAGLSWLSDQPDVIAFIMTLAAGGILYLMFQEIAPEVAIRNDWLPPMGALLGFFLGVLGAALVG